jgi:hypothetical protein
LRLPSGRVADQALVTQEWLFDERWTNVLETSRRLWCFVTSGITFLMWLMWICMWLMQWNPIIYPQKKNAGE